MDYSLFKCRKKEAHTITITIINTTPHFGKVLFMWAFAAHTQLSLAFLHNIF